MISNSFLNCNSKTRAEMTELFLLASMSFLLGQDWKSLFKRIANRSAGTKKKFCKFWLTKQDKDILTAIDTFLETYK